MKSKAGQIWQRDKKQVLSLLVVAAFISLFLEIAISYREFPLVAMGQSAFYLTFFGNLFLLGFVPLIVAYISGLLLTFIAILIKDKKHYQAQHFVAWLLLVTFTYYVAVMAIHKHSGLDSLVFQCQTKAKSEEAQVDCIPQAIAAYPKIQRCLAYPLGKQRRDCLAKVVS